MKEEELDSRKRMILRAIIEDYIMTAEPVGSRTLSKSHDLALSPATIRNEMADLEDMGYLVQPYTSAGRIPSEKGYRLYVDELVEDCELSINEMKKIRDALDGRIKSFTDIIKIASGVISELTDYATVAVTPAKSDIFLKAVQIVPVEVGKALVFVVLENEKLQNTFIEIDEGISASDIINLSNMINQELAGKIFDKKSFDNIKNDTSRYNIEYDKIEPVLRGIMQCLEEAEIAHVYMEGAINILNHPEFSDIIRAREFLTMIQREDKMIKLITDNMTEGGIMVKIGNENIFEEIKNCSVITATYSINDKIIGSIGIIGPTRMQYGKVISSMNAIKNSLNSQIINLIESSDNIKKEERKKDE